MENFDIGGLYSFQRELKKTENSLAKRLRSIEKDYKFLSKILTMYFPKFPLIANLRCGLWYSPTFDSTCYFKSTDGHYRTWAFNLGRNNFQVADLAIKNNGVVIIDSTRKGKLYPDSFNRTIPIWVGVLNATILKRKIDLGIELLNQGDWEIFVMPAWISSSETQQIKELIPNYTSKIIENAVLLESIDNFARDMKKPMRCLLFNPASKFHLINPEDLPFLPIICISASEQQNDYNTNDYIQGAGDDEEAWSMNLTPKLFWENIESLLHSNVNEDEVAEEVNAIVSKDKERNESAVSLDSSSPSFTNNSFSWISTSKIAICSDKNATTDSIWNLFTAFINCSENDYTNLSSNPNYLHCPIAEGKSDKNKISRALPIALSFIRKHILQGNSVIIHCYYDLEVPICLALASFLNFYDCKGVLLDSPRKDYTKEFMRTMQYYVTQFCVEARISRNCSNDLNRFFMSPLHGSNETKKYWKELK